MSFVPNKFFSIVFCSIVWLAAPSGVGLRADVVRLLTEDETSLIHRLEMIESAEHEILLSAYEVGDAQSTKDFIHWTPENSEPGPTSGTRCPKRGMKSGRFRPIQHVSGPHLGPWALSYTVPRSQIAARL